MQETSAATTQNAATPSLPSRRAVAAKILPLTSVRFLAALFVVLFHLAPESWGIARSSYLGRLILLGYISVPFFFALSGLVLALAYLETRRLVGVRSFLTARFARIYPALFACLLFDCPHFLFKAEPHLFHDSVPRIFANFVVGFAALGAWFPHLEGLDLPSWSITVEFFFYLLFPLMAGWLWHLPARTLWLLAISVYVANNLLVFALMHTSIDPLVLERDPLTHVADFVLGICLARLLLFILRDRYWSSFAHRFSLVGAVLGATLILIIPALPNQIPKEFMQHTLLFPVFAITILSLASGNPLLDAIFSQRWFVILGEASFALYLVHAPLHYYFAGLIVHHRVFVYPYILSAIGLSLISFFYLETPARQWILRLSHVRSIENLPTQTLAQ
jgi:peptidoglycan/LPS O-acetylase OafA/YrhL